MKRFKKNSCFRLFFILAVVVPALPGMGEEKAELLQAPQELAVRKNSHTLTDQEKSDFVNAILELKRRGVYDRFVQTHVDAWNTPTPAKDETPSIAVRNAAHRGPSFLPWHRAYLHLFELELQKVNPSVTIPYWDWTADAQLADPASSPIWSDGFMGGQGTMANEWKVVDGPFCYDRGWKLTVRAGPGGTELPEFLQRGFGQFRGPTGVLIDSLPTLDDVNACLKEPLFDFHPWSSRNFSRGFRSRLEGWVLKDAVNNIDRLGVQTHNRVHVWVGGSMRSPSSPNDPIFWLHHSFVDKLWVDWVEKQRANNPHVTDEVELYLPKKNGPKGHNLRDRMPVLRPNFRPIDVLDHRALGYQYDSGQRATKEMPWFLLPAVGQELLTQKVEILEELDASTTEDALVVAPSWELPNAQGNALGSKQLQGNPFLMVFHQGLGCPHCAEQLQGFGHQAGIFRELGLKVVAISADKIPPESMEIYRNEFNVDFPLLFDESRDVFRKFGCGEDGELHGLVLIDESGMVRWKDVSDTANTNLDAILSSVRDKLNLQDRDEDNDQRDLIVLAEESDSSVGFYDSKTGREVASISVGMWPHEIELSPDGNTAYVTNFGVKDYDERIGRPGGSISVIDVRNMCEVKRLYTFRNKSEYEDHRAPHGVKLSPNGTRLYVNSEATDRMLVYDVSDEDAIYPITEWDVPEGTHNFTFSPDGSHLWVVAGRNGVTRFDTVSGTSNGHFSCKGAVRGLTYTVDGKHLIASASDEVCLVDPTSLKVIKRIENLGARQILYSQPTPDGKYLLAPAVWEGQLLVIDLLRGRVIHRLQLGADPIHVKVAPSGNVAYVTHGRSKFISEIDLETFSETRRIGTRGGPNGIAIAKFVDSPPRKSIRFGACIPLSGPTSADGQDMRLGYQLWEERLNEKGGLVVGGEPYSVEIVYKDTKSDINENFIRKLTEELIDDDGVQFLLGAYPSPPNEYAGRVSDERQIPMVTAGGAAEDIYDQGFEYIFGIMSPARGFLIETLRLLETAEPKPKSILFVSCTDKAAFQDAQTTAEFAESIGMTLLVPDESAGLPVREPGIVVFPHGHTDFAKYVSAIKELDPDLVSITGHREESVPFVQEAKRQDLSPNGFIFSVGPAVPAFVNELGDLAQHMIGAAMWTSVQESFGHDPFIRPSWYDEAFFARYSKQPGYHAAGATACGLVYEDAIRRAQSLDPTAVRDALRLTEMTTFYSGIEFDDRGLNDSRPLTTIQLRKVNGKIVHIPLWPAEIAGENKAVWPFPGW